jgi:formylglycine-generating enzyme required for sulfatase activity
MGLGGNAWEWEESSVDLSNNDGSLIRGVRGGNWGNGSIFLSSSVRLDEYDPNFQSDSFGFRVARLHAVPEPSMMVIGTLFGLGGLVAKRRMKK